MAGSDTTDSAEGTDFRRIAWALAGVVAPRSNSSRKKQVVGKTLGFNRSHYCRGRIGRCKLSAHPDTLGPNAVMVPIRVRIGVSAASQFLPARRLLSGRSIEQRWGRAHYGPPPLIVRLGGR